MSQRDLARLLGVNPATVSRDARRGMPTGDVEAARAWRLENLRARMKPASAAATPSDGGASRPPGGKGGDSDDDDDDPDYWRSRARREAAEAKTAEFKLAELSGQLIRVEAVKSAHARRIAALRDALLQVPARMAPVLAAENDLLRCTALLEAEMHGVLAVMTAAEGA